MPLRTYLNHGAVRGYQVGGEVREEDYERLRRLTGINDEKLLKQRMDELKGGGFFGTKKSVPELLSEMEAAKSAEFRRTNVSGLAGARPESVTGIDEVQPYSYPTPMGLASAPIVASQPVDPAAVAPGPVVRPPAPQRAADAAAAAAAAAKKPPVPDAAAAEDTSQKPVDDDGYAERMKKLLDDDEGDMTPREKSMALIQAGAAMMAGASKPGATFLGSAGEGLTKGLEGFNETRSNRAVKRMKQAALLQAERQAGIENKRGDKKLELDERQVGQADERIRLEKSQQKLEELKNGAMTQYYLAEAKRSGRPVEPSVFKEKLDALIDSGVPKAEATRQAAGLEAKEQPESKMYSEALNAAIKIVGSDPNLIELTPEEKFERAQQMAANKVSAQMSGVRSTGGGAGQSSSKVGESSGEWGIVKD